MPFEIVGLDSVGREEREEDLSGVNEVGFGMPKIGWKNLKKGWKSLKGSPGGIWKGVKTGFKKHKKQQPAEVNDTLDPQVIAAMDAGIQEAMQELGLVGRTTLTKAEYHALYKASKPKVRAKLPGKHYAMIAVENRMRSMGIKIG
jgi:hypothetical protein